MSNLTKVFSSSSNQEVITRNDGIIRIGGEVELSDRRTYLVENIVQSSENSNKSDYLIYLKDKSSPICVEDVVKILPINFNIYRWKGYYILANSIEQAQRIWDTYIDILKIKSEDGNSKSLKLSKKLNSGVDSELFPRLISRLKCESSFPCIVDSLEFDKEPIYEYKYLV